MTTKTPATVESVLRQHAEQQFAEELAELAQGRRPASARRAGSSRPGPSAPICSGGTLENGFTVTPKYIGNARLIEIAVATLATDRALLLFGVPGTAKSWVSRASRRGDHRRLHAARPGHRRHRRGARSATAGTTRGCWPRGRRSEALVVSPMMRAMQRGQDRARRGADAHPRRGAGHADHHPLGEDAARSPS